MLDTIMRLFNLLFNLLRLRDSKLKGLTKVDLRKLKNKTTLSFKNIVRSLLYIEKLYLKLASNNS